MKSVVTQLKKFSIVGILVAILGAKTLPSFSADLIIGLFNDLGTHSDILAAIKTDHSSIILELVEIQEIEESCRGPGFWKLNTFVLAGADYTEMISNVLRNWLEDAKICQIIGPNGTG